MITLGSKQRTKAKTYARIADTLKETLSMEPDKGINNIRNKLDTLNNWKNIIDLIPEGDMKKLDESKEINEIEKIIFNKIKKFYESMLNRK